MSDPARVLLTVNGQERAVEVREDASLMSVLRGRLGLVGVRSGCGVGECGACTVLVDGAPVRSCTTQVGSVAGAPILTPEGLGRPDDPHPVQRTFLEMQAAQCGYCINGIIMAVVALCGDDGDVSRRDAATALRDHICRCGTHPRVLEAALRSCDRDATRRGGRDGEPRDAEISSCRTEVRSEVGSARTQAADATLPRELERDPDVSTWLGLLETGQVEVRSGRSEIGQGVRIALGQIVAAHTGLTVVRIVVRPASTECGPDEGYTAGSRSMQHGGVVLAMAAVAFRRLLLDRAADHLGAPAEELAVTPEGAVRGPSGRQVDLTELRAGGPISGRIRPSDRPRWAASTLGGSPARTDLREKLTGAPGFVHDLSLPGMLHARAVLPPTYDAELRAAEVGPVEEMPGVEAVVHEGRLLLVIATGEDEAVRAAAALEARTRWADPGLAFSGDEFETLRALPVEPDPAGADDAAEADRGSGHTLRASYRKPYELHGAVAPSCAVALADADGLTVWSHTQGVHPLRRELAALLGEDSDEVTVVHADGPGCYGHNGADDAAAFAAVAARTVPGRPVRFQYETADEFRWEPYGTAMLADLEATVGDDGRVTGWRHRARSDAQTARPRGHGDRVVPAWLRGDDVTRQWPGPSAGAARNIEPLYAFPAVATAVDHVRGPLRTGSLRSLGAFLNVFAIESFVDELAASAGVDPLAFRLAHLEDERARDVLEAVADAAGWTPHVGPSGRGRGLAVARYDGTKAYVALAVDVTVDVDRDLVDVDRIVIAADAGTVVHTEGLRQQLEGGALQGLSRTRYERLAVDRRGVRSEAWSSYPVLRFDEVPPLHLIILDRPGSPPLGAGEAATPPVPGAVANAIDDATGIRLRSLPITPESIRRRLLDMSAAEAERVRRQPSPDRR